MKPYVICHMLMSIDGRVTGSFLGERSLSEAMDLYYKINRESSAEAFACGRVTMQESFANSNLNLENYENDINFDDFVAIKDAKRYALSFDRYGKVAWKNSFIDDQDPGYVAHVIEILTRKVDKRYLSYLKKRNISYIFAGDDDLDINLALEKLYQLFNIKTILLEGGSVINSAFINHDDIDELSIVLVPLTGEKGDKPLYDGIEVKRYNLIKCDVYNDYIYLNYKKR